MISLTKELELARNYFEIHKIRYEELINFRNYVKDIDKYEIVPLSCQFLIENAIKHNVINVLHHLHIEVRTEGSYLIVRNNRNPKDSGNKSSTGLGLENLKQRFKHFTSQSVIVEIDENYFSVKLPLING